MTISLVMSAGLPLGVEVVLDLFFCDRYGQLELLGGRISSAQRCGFRLQSTSCTSPSQGLPAFPYWICFPGKHLRSVVKRWLTTRSRAQPCLCESRRLCASLCLRVIQSCIVASCLRFTMSSSQSSHTKSTAQLSVRVAVTWTQKGWPNCTTPPPNDVQHLMIQKPLVLHYNIHISCYQHHPIFWEWLNTPILGSVRFEVSCL